MDFLEDLYKLFVRKPGLILVAIFMAGSVIRAVVQGLTQARKRREEFEQRRDARGSRPIDLDEMLEPRAAEPDVESEMETEVEPPPPPPSRPTIRRTEPEPVPVLAIPERTLLTNGFEEERGMSSSDASMQPLISQFTKIEEDLSGEKLENEPGSMAIPRAVAGGVPQGLDAWRSAIVLTEVLGPPLSMRPGLR